MNYLLHGQKYIEVNKILGFAVTRQRGYLQIAFELGEERPYLIDCHRAISPSMENAMNLMLNLIKLMESHEQLVEVRRAWTPDPPTNPMREAIDRDCQILDMMLQLPEEEMAEMGDPQDWFNYD